MQVQDLEKLAPSLLQAAELPAPFTSPQRWRYLPIHWLQHCESVDTQFVGFQVQFESAIAICPSNPRFYIGDAAIAIMSPLQGNQLRMHVGKAVTAIEVWLMGGQSVTLSALDEGGHCVAIAHTCPAPETINNSPLVAHKVTLDTHAADTVLLNSKLPFILTRLALQQT